MEKQCISIKEIEKQHKEKEHREKMIKTILIEEGKKRWCTKEGWTKLLKKKGFKNIKKGEIGNIIEGGKHERRSRWGKNNIHLGYYYRLIEERKKEEHKEPEKEKKKERNLLANIKIQLTNNEIIERKANWVDFGANWEDFEGRKYEIPLTLFIGDYDKEGRVKNRTIIPFNKINYIFYDFKKQKE